MLVGGIVGLQTSIKPWQRGHQREGLTGDHSRAAVLVNVLCLAHRNGFHVHD